MMVVGEKMIAIKSVLVPLGYDNTKHKDEILVLLGI